MFEFLVVRMPKPHEIYNNILALRERQKTVVKCKETVVFGYQDGLAAVANRGVVLAFCYGFRQKRPRLMYNRSFISALQNDF